MANKYIVMLPENLQGSSIQGYARLSKVGETEASTPAKAVTHVVFRNTQNKNTPKKISRSDAKLICHRLKEMGGLEKYAVLVPELAGKDELTFKERKTFTRMALASELAGRYGGKPEDYYGKADDLLAEAEHNSYRR